LPQSIPATTVAMTPERCRRSASAKDPYAAMVVRVISIIGSSMRWVALDVA
jgi:hypothetical protein